MSFIKSRGLDIGRTSAIARRHGDEHRCDSDRHVQTARWGNFLTTAIYNFLHRSALGLSGREMQAALATALVPSVGGTTASSTCSDLTCDAAVPTAEVAAPADAEPERADAALTFAKEYLFAGVCHRDLR
jgi:hypothetical protein